MNDLLRCPQTHQPLQPAPAELVERLRSARETVRNRDGEMPELFDGGLVTADGTWFYPTRGGVPVLLAGEAIAANRQSELP
jgi:uncharacterized protein YbaR (Trm112 family)